MNDLKTICQKELEVNKSAWLNATEDCHGTSWMSVLPDSWGTFHVQKSVVAKNAVKQTHIKKKINRLEKFISEEE